MSRFPPAVLIPTMLVAALAACSSGPPTPRAMLNENTGVTLTAVAQPLLFARERTAATADGHDYATLVAVERDEAGKYTDLLLLYRWSISPVPPPPRAGAGRLSIQTDGRTIELQPLERVPIDMSRRRDLFVPDKVDVVIYAYGTDLDTMREIARSRELTLHLPQEPRDTPFWLWGDGRPALAQLVEQLTGH